MVMEAPITHHSKLTLVRISIIAMVNYAPLVEMDSPRDLYESLTGRWQRPLRGCSTQTRCGSASCAPGEGVGVRLLVYPSNCDALKPSI